MRVESRGLCIFAVLVAALCFAASCERAGAPGRSALPELGPPPVAKEALTSNGMEVLWQSQALCAKDSPDGAVVGW